MNKLCIGMELIVHKRPCAAEGAKLSTFPHTISTVFARHASKLSVDGSDFFFVIPSLRSLY